MSVSDKSPEPEEEIYEDLDFAMLDIEYVEQPSSRCSTYSKN